MKSKLRVFLVRGGYACLLLVLSLALVYAQSETTLSDVALQQIQELLQEKESRTPVQQKLGSQIVYGMKAYLGQQLTPSIDALPGTLDSLNTVPGQGTLVDIQATVSSDLLSAIAQAGGAVLSTSPDNRQVRARLPLDMMEAVAARPDVQFVQPAVMSRTHRLGSGRRGAGVVKPLVGPNRITGHSSFFNMLNPLVLFVGSLTTQGVVTHSANTARSTYGINGTGVKVGVLSDSAEQTNFLIGTGDLPASTTIVQDIIGDPGSSEGTAMMEIVYDMAPGVQLFFASAFNGPASFASNIRTLRFTYHCDVIVDDVSYGNEAPFQDDIIAQAVNDVTADGALYFSAAGNGGNVTSNNSSAWEGDFVSGGVNPLLPGYTLHSFGAAAFDRTAVTTGVLDLFWSDPLGSSSNDYDLFVVNAAGTAVIASSTGFQNGTQTPFEEVFSPSGFPGNSRVVIVARAGAAPRALHLEAFFGEPLQLATSGVTRGHNAGPNTVSTAAVYWNSGLGTRPFGGGSRNPTEIFSSDGPRKMFFNANGTAITPGNFLFATNGGTTFIKPDIAAADGVTTRTPGFNPFFGTSAAAPHAAAIAALIKSAKPSLTNTQIYNAMTSTALDIRAVGIDRDSGYGIVMTPVAVAKALQ